jgi:glycosyltransferase involved in cell wall biosynthesis
MFSLHIDTARTWRGGQYQALLTVRGLRRRGRRAALAAQPRGELFRRTADDTDVYPLAPRADLDPAAAWRLSRLVRHLAPDVIHAHDAHAVAVASLARRLVGPRTAPPLIASRRVDFHLRGNPFSRWKYRQVDRFICASAAIRDMLAGDGVPPERACVVHEGIDIDRIERASALDLHREFGLPAGCPIVGNVAALVPHKGQRHLVEAAARVVRQVPGARLLIVGAGELEGALARQIGRLHLDGKVILTGFRPDVPAVLKSLDLFVMSSVTEGLGTSVLDAMAAGLAVVGTRAGGIPESVVDGQTGLLAPPADASALARAITELLRDAAKRRAFGAAGRERARAAFGADRMVDETAAVYADVLARTRSGPRQRRRAGHQIVGVDDPPVDDRGGHRTP